MKLILNSIGLVCGIIGALSMFKYGIPSVLSKSGANVIADYGDPKSKKKAKRYNMLSKIGIITLCLGFLLQLISNFLPA